jgi:ribosomal protein S18 acetylase RimI-like enzyme
MPDITIRKLTDADIDSLAELYKLFWNDDQNINKMKLRFDELKNNQKYIFLCAAIDDRVIGTIMGIICEELYGDCKPFLVMEDLVVHNDFRNMKIGTLLLTELEKIGKENECSQIIFITESNRKETISFYEKLGFNSKTHIGFKKKLK